MDTCRFLADFVSTLTYEDLTPWDRDRTIMLIKDFYAAVIAGKRINGRFNDAITSVVFAMGGTPESTVLGRDGKLPAASAALLNGVYAHGADMDDGTKVAMGHVGAPVIPAVLALAEKEKASGKEVMTAIVAGYEVFVRLGGACQPGMIQRGFHSSGVVGCVAAAAASAKLLGLDAEGIYQAMAISTTQSAGLMSVVESGQELKPLNPGRGAQTGVFSAQLAAAGAGGPANPFDMAKGFFWAFAKEVDRDLLTAPAAGDHKVCSCYQKPYPSCRHTHPGIDAAIALRPQLPSIDDIAEANLYIYPTGIEVAGRITVPQNLDEAKFSIQYAVANTLVTGGYTLSDLDVSKAPVASAELARRIKLIPDESQENKAAGIRGSRLELKLKDGTVLDKTIPLPKGDDKTPFSDEDMARKLRECAADALSAAAQAELLEKISAIDGSWDGVVPNMILGGSSLPASSGVCCPCQE